MKKDQQYCPRDSCKGTDDYRYNVDRNVSLPQKAKQMKKIYSNQNDKAYYGIYHKVHYIFDEAPKYNKDYESQQNQDDSVDHSLSDNSARIIDEDTGYRGIVRLNIIPLSC